MTGGHAFVELDRILDRTGQPFWQDESYDHYLREPSLGRTGFLCGAMAVVQLKLADETVCPSVPGMGRIYRDERSSTELITTTVAKRKA